MKIVIKTVILLLLSSCANIVPPTGGNKDLDPPKLIGKRGVENMKHVNTRIVEFEFNEFIQTNKWDEHFYISPPIKNKIKKKIKAKKLSLTIEDSLTSNTTYYLSLNSCIKDINEGNILDTLSYIFATSDNFDTLRLSGELKDAYNLKVIDNAWVMLFNEEIHDSLIFKTKPSYIAKTNKDGFFNFQNLNSDIFKIVALNSFDFFYNEGEKMAFYDTTINASKDSFISLFAFDPIIIFDTTKTDTIIRLNSTLLDTSINDTIKPQDMLLGKLEILSSINSSCIIQLLQNDKLVKEAFFTKPPYIIKEIPAAKYDLKLIYDTNNDSSWTTGSWRRRAQAERVINYPSEIVIRSNWDLELEWVIEE
mgnify:CR=1 FL=1|tara:strand:+ start:2200 stop:3291 length:1092 start_codon:yes stop_codon:yes gene_type:complete